MTWQRAIQRRFFAIVSTRGGLFLVLLLGILVLNAVLHVLDQQLGTTIVCPRGSCTIDWADNVGLKSAEDTMCTEPIDAVYTWVNGSDPRHMAEVDYWQLKEHEEQEAASANQVRSSAAGATNSSTTNTNTSADGSGDGDELDSNEPGASTTTATHEKTKEEERFTRTISRTLTDVAGLIHRTVKAVTQGNGDEKKEKEKEEAKDDERKKNIQEKKEQQSGRSRFEDHDELLYSLRSLVTNAPWIRRVYLVTNGQVPTWLNLNDNRIVVVPHSAIFPNVSHLPVFSSPAIEANLHRIPGLSRRFLYFNDDTFFAAPVVPSDFYTAARGHRIYFSWPVPNCADGCPNNWLSDGYCDEKCNTTDCDYDGGDCIGEKAKQANTMRSRRGGRHHHHKPDPGEYQGRHRGRVEAHATDDGNCAPSCQKSWIGDKFCDSACDNIDCGFDGLDCGVEQYTERQYLRLPAFKLERTRQQFSLGTKPRALFIDLTPIFPREGSKILEGYVDSDSWVHTSTISQKNKALVITVQQEKSANAAKNQLCHIEIVGQLSEKDEEGTEVRRKVVVHINITRMTAHFGAGKGEKNLPSAEDSRLLFNKTGRWNFTTTEAHLVLHATEQKRKNETHLNPKTPTGSGAVLAAAGGVQWKKKISSKGGDTTAGRKALFSALKKADTAAPHPPRRVDEKEEEEEEEKKDGGSLEKKKGNEEGGYGIGVEGVNQDAAAALQQLLGEHRRREEEKRKEREHHGARPRRLQSVASDDFVDKGDGDTGTHHQHQLVIQEDTTTAIALDAGRNRRELMTKVNVLIDDAGEDEDDTDARTVVEERSYAAGDLEELEEEVEPKPRSRRRAPLTAEREEEIRRIRQRVMNKAIEQEEHELQHHQDWNSAFKQFLFAELPRGGEKKDVQGGPFPLAKQEARRRLLDMFGDSLKFGNRLLTKTFGSITRKVPSHMVHLIDREVVEDLWDKWPEEFEASSSARFRARYNMQYAFLHMYYIIHAHHEWDGGKRFFEEKLDENHNGVIDDAEVRRIALFLWEKEIPVSDLRKALEALPADLVFEGSSAGGKQTEVHSRTGTVTASRSRTVLQDDSREHRDTSDGQEAAPTTSSGVEPASADVTAVPILRSESPTATDAPAAVSSLPLSTAAVTVEPSESPATGTTTAESPPSGSSALPLSTPTPGAADSTTNSPMTTSAPEEVERQTVTLTTTPDDKKVPKPPLPVLSNILGKNATRYNHNKTRAAGNRTHYLAEETTVAAPSPAAPTTKGPSPPQADQLPHHRGPHHHHRRHRNPDDDLRVLNDEYVQLVQLLVEKAANGIGVETVKAPTWSGNLTAGHFNGSHLELFLREKYGKDLKKYRHELSPDENDITFFMVRDNATIVQHNMDHVLYKRNKFLCINDNMNHSHPEYPKVVEVIQTLLKRIFPNPSPFELPEGEVNSFTYLDEIDLADVPSYAHTRTYKFLSHVDTLNTVRENFLRRTREAQAEGSSAGSGSGSSFKAALAAVQGSFSATIVPAQMKGVMVMYPLYLVLLVLIFLLWLLRRTLTGARRRRRVVEGPMTATPSVQYA